LSYDLGNPLGARVTYTPNADYNGSDSFVFRVSDGQTPPLSADKTVNITITADPDDPTGAPTATTTSGGAASGKYLVGELYQIDTSAISDVDTSDPLTFSYSTTFQKLNSMDEWETDTDIDPITTASFTLLQAHQLRRLVTVVTQTNGGNNSWTLTGTTMVLDETQIVQDSGTSSISGSEYTDTDGNANYSSSGLTDVKLSDLSTYLQNGYPDFTFVNASLHLVSNNTNLITLTDSSTSSTLQFLPSAVEDANGNTTISVGIVVDSVLRKTLTYNISIAPVDSADSFSITGSYSNGTLTISYDTTGVLDELASSGAYQYYINVYDDFGDQLNQYSQVVQTSNSATVYLEEFVDNDNYTRTFPYASGGYVEIYATLLQTSDNGGGYIGSDGTTISTFNVTTTNNVVSATVNI
jgi:hypothetical protein